MREDILVMRQDELKRLELIKKVIGKEVKQKEVSEFLGISERQVRRVVKRVKESGAKGIIHKLRGKANCRRISEAIKEKVLRIYGSQYKDFGASLASEKLAKEGIKLSRETLRKWIRQEGYQIGKRKKSKHRLWRARKEYYGEMVQMDGSHHNWLEGRGEELVLMGYIDDATNRVFGRFYRYEGTIPAMDSFKRYCLKYGVPQSVYLDCHHTYRSSYREERYKELLDRGDGLSKFERALKELGVGVIHAYSPQAKGRVERLFRTLQDRLVKELRLGDAKTIEEANGVLEKYLIEHNRRYLVEPVKAANLHRRSPTAWQLDNILCKKNKHTLRKDFTVAHETKLYQILQWTNAEQIEVWEHVDGRMQMMGGKISLKFKPINKPPVKKRIRLTQRSPMRILDRGRSFGTIKSRPRLMFNLS